jgi:hypothetical protein
VEVFKEKGTLVATWECSSADVPQPFLLVQPDFVLVSNRLDKTLVFTLEGELIMTWDCGYEAVATRNDAFFCLDIRNKKIRVLLKQLQGKVIREWDLPSQYCKWFMIHESVVYVLAARLSQCFHIFTLEGRFMGKRDVCFWYQGVRFICDAVLKDGCLWVLDRHGVKKMILL